MTARPFIADVVWHSCQGCGNRWPFPFGAQGYADRQWHCPSCHEEDCSRRLRAMQSEIDALKRRVAGA